MLTNTWHEADAHTSDTTSLKISIDSGCQPADRDSDHQRYCDVIERQTREFERQAIIANAAAPHIVGKIKL